MKVYYFSDPHLDMWFPDEEIDSQSINTLFNWKLPLEKEEVLVIAGDLGHSNKQNKDLLLLLQKYFFKQIIFVLGNHDYWLLPDNDAQVFNTSFERIEDMRQWAKNQENIHCLNGDVVEINGVKFGGCDSWYDGSYYAKNNNEHSLLESYWREWMNDGKYIDDIASYHDLFLKEIPKIEAVYKSCDVMVTHVCPSTLKKHSRREDKDERKAAFYCFNGNNFIKNGSMKYWIFGHTHKVFQAEHLGKQLLCNAIGYPNKNSYQVKLKSFEIKDV